MSKQQKLKFTIRQDGYVTEEITGLKGTQCLDLTEKLEKQLGTVQWRKETDEYYQTVTKQENVTLQRNQNEDQE